MADDEHEYVQRTGRARRGPQDGNDRVARITRWLASTGRPAGATELVLSCASAGEDPEVVQRWPRDAVLPELGRLINDLLQDQADDKGSTISGMLVWQREDGSAYLSKGFRAVCRVENQEVIRPLDATVQSQISQLQRHNEAYANQLAMVACRQDERWERVLGVYERTIETLTRDRDAAVQEAASARAEADQATELAAEATQEAEHARTAAEEQASGDLLGKVIEVGMKQLTSGGGKPS